ncbi:MAG: oligosaccharide flippase family protein [Chitinophagaceae bacterium]|nr:oligosaccharide flippase family protein [Chitinophagaceae bacterium]
MQSNNDNVRATGLQGGLVEKAKQLFNRYKKSSYSSGILLAISQSVVALVFILIDYIYSKKLTKVEFGAWKKMYFIIQFVTPLLSLGFPEGFKFYIAKENNKPLFFSNFFFTFLAIAVTELVVIVFLNIFHYAGWVDLNVYFLVSLLFPFAFFCYGINQSLKYTFINEQRVFDFIKVTLVSLTTTIVFIILSGLLVSVYKSYYMVLGVLLYILTFGLPLYALYGKSGLTLNRSLVNMQQVKKMFAIGFPLYCASFIGVISINLNKGVVAFLESKEAFAVFSVGALEIPVFAMLSASFSQNIYPKLVQYVQNGEKERAKRLWIDTTRKVSYITYPILLILMLFAKQIIFLIYSKEYLDSVILFQTFLLIGLFRNNFYGALIVASGKTKFITFYSALSLVSNLIISLSLYYFFGIRGIVYGNLMSVVIINCLQLNHENLLGDYVRKFLFDKKIFFLVLAILAAYFYAVFKA